MARIRTIKPEFWNDEKIGQLKRDCRLLFIGLWNISDDYGTVRSNPTWIKSQLFPYDDDLRVSELSKWLDALEDARMLEPFTYNKEGFYNIRSFHSHQKVEKPSKPQIPLNIKTSLLSRGVVGEGSVPDIVIGSSTEEVVEGETHAQRLSKIEPPPNYSRPKSAPTFDQVRECFYQIGKPDLAKGFFDYYEGLNWHKGITPIINWRSFANRWVAGEIAKKGAPEAQSPDEYLSERKKREEKTRKLSE